VIALAVILPLLVIIVIGVFFWFKNKKSKTVDLAKDEESAKNDDME
jgi:uncharacterized protein YxeA